MSLEAVPLQCQKMPGIEALDKYKDVQLISSEYVAGEEHMKRAIAHAEQAFKRGENISKDPLIEVVVMASLERQIKSALEIFGIGDTKKVVAICEKYPSQLIEEYGCCEDKSILEIDEKRYEKIKEKFKIEEREIVAVSGEKFEERVATLQKIIAERMALLNKV